MNQKKILRNKALVNGKTIIGIDPAKSKHQAAIQDADELPLGTSFSFAVSADGFQNVLWRNIAKYLPDCNAQNTVFAIETSCSLWQTLAWYPHRVRGYTVVQVSPLSTRYERPVMNLDFLLLRV